MKVEYYSYYSITKKYMKPHTGVQDIRKSLPLSILTELMAPPSDCPTPQILIEAHKDQIIQYLDKVMQIKKKNFDRRYQVEITKDEINNYDYFFIDLRSLELGKHIDYQFSPPTCKTEPCPWGFKITSPTQIKSRHIRNLNLGKVYSNWEMNPRFVISKKIKEIFNEQNVTGLRYDKCLVSYSHLTESPCNTSDEHFYTAEFTNGVAEHAHDIFIHYHCKKHDIIINFDRYDVYFPKNVVLPYDFQMINRIIVKGKEYRYRHSDFFVSRKVLEILLKHCKDNLRQRGFLLKKSFVPVTFGMRE